MNGQITNALKEIQRVLELEARAIEQCNARFRTLPHQEILKKVLELFAGSLDHGGKIVVTGMGKSGKVAQKIAATFSSTGSLAVYLHPSEGIHGDLGLLSPKDTILALSHSGNTDEIVRLLPALQQLRNIHGWTLPLIGIGGNPHSQLAEQSTAWIDASIEKEACPHGFAPTTSTTLALAIGDALAVALMELRGFRRDQFATLHPGGALGRRLDLRVRDLMIQDRLPRVSPDAGADEVLLLLTERRLGAVLVTLGNQGSLLGLITEGDIRRALQHREKFFQLTAEKIMTAQPVTISAEASAADALALMENRPYQISVLPVVVNGSDTKNELFPVGILRLHDLVRTL